MRAKKQHLRLTKQIAAGQNKEWDTIDLNSECPNGMVLTAIRLSYGTGPNLFFHFWARRRLSNEGLGIFAEGWGCSSSGEWEGRAVFNRGECTFRVLIDVHTSSEWFLDLEYEVL